MNSDQINAILLKDAIEYLIFDKTKVSCVINKTQDISGIITDKNEDNVLIKLDNDSKIDINPLTDIKVVSNYRSKRLEFKIIVENYDQATKTLAGRHQMQGNLIDTRTQKRTKFNCEDLQLSAELEIETMHGVVNVTVEKVDEFSYKTLSCYIDRSKGLIIPNDIVKIIVIKSENREIFVASGNVERTKRNGEEIFVVISLDNPGSLSAYDIGHNKRQSERLIFGDHNDAFIEFTHPFTKTRKLALLYDISNYGISAVMKDSMYALPPGLIISEVSIQLPLHPRVNVKLRVKGFYLESDDSGYRINMEFVDATPELIKIVSGFVQQKLSTNLRDATIDDIEELWYFYFETGFIYHKKRKQIQETSDIVRHTFKQLLKTNTPLVKKILYKEEGLIKGHVTAIKVFDQTLMVQHLNALKSKDGPAAMHVIRAITAYFLDNKANTVLGSRYICFYYRPDNFYPKLVFGNAVNLIEDENKCWTEDFIFCLPNYMHKNSDSNEIIVRDAISEDLAELENLLFDRNDFRTIRLEGLTRENMQNMKITSEYERIGLYRYRKIFAAHHVKTKQWVFAVCTYASPGLNFSELTNAIKLYYPGKNNQITQELVNAVCSYALDSYQRTQLHNPVLLLKKDQLVPACFIAEKEYTLFALDIRHTKRFKDATEHVYAHFKEYVKENRLKVS